MEGDDWSRCTVGRLRKSLNKIQYNINIYTKITDKLNPINDKLNLIEGNIFHQ